MFDGVLARFRAARSRLWRLERREVREFRRWVEHTTTLVHLSVLVLVPLLIGVVTYLSNHTAAVSFLLFPPLASGSYTLFAEPEGRYSSPQRFVGGLTLGAVCGAVAVRVAPATLSTPAPVPGAMQVTAGAAALSVALTAVATWMLNLELPTAFSTALLVLMTGSSSLVYVAGVALSSAVVAAVFVLWRDELYEERARYLYGTTQADDHVLVPMRGETAAETAMFGARIAAAHDAGKVVLLDVVSGRAAAAAERDALEETAADGGVQGDPGNAASEAEAEVAERAAEQLESRAHRVETEVGVPCEVVVAAGGDPVDTTLSTARETNCDLVVTPYEEENGGLSGYVRALFRAPYDVVAFRSVRGRTRWKRVMVPVRRAGDVAHAMLDYAERLASPTGTVSVCTCIDREDERRETESMLADLTETLRVSAETRVSRSSVEAFLQHNDEQYDVVFMGASTDRSTASRFLSPPTFQRVRDLETDVAVVHRG